MRIGKISLAAIAVVTMAGAPVVAQVATAQSSEVRASVASDDENNIQGSGIIIAILAAAAIIGGIIIAADNDDDEPTSP